MTIEKKEVKLNMLNNLFYTMVKIGDNMKCVQFNKEEFSNYISVDVDKIEPYLWLALGTVAEMFVKNAEADPGNEVKEISMSYVEVPPVDIDIFVVKERTFSKNGEKVSRYVFEKL